MSRIKGLSMPSELSARGGAGAQPQQGRDTILLSITPSAVGTNPDLFTEAQAHAARNLHSQCSELSSHIRMGVQESGGYRKYLADKSLVGRLPHIANLEQYMRNNRLNLTMNLHRTGPHSHHTYQVLTADHLANAMKTNADHVHIYGEYDRDRNNMSGGQMFIGIKDQGGIRYLDDAHFEIRADVDEHKYDRMDDKYNIV